MEGEAVAKGEDKQFVINPIAPGDLRRDLQTDWDEGRPIHGPAAECTLLSSHLATYTLERQRWRMRALEGRRSPASLSAKVCTAARDHCMEP